MAVNAPERLPTDEGASSDTSPLASCLVRLGWMGAGNAALLLLAVGIIQEPSWTLTAKDALFWTVVAAVVVLRYVDVTRLGGRTADGEPATRRHLVRHAVGLVVGSALLWTIVQSIQLLA